jgi:hypothetical protein
VCYVGFHRGEQIRYDLLAAKPRLVDSTSGILDWFKNDPGWQGITPQKLANTMELADERLEWISAQRRGYCGWLLTNETFLSEHNSLLRRHRRQMGEYRLPTLGSMPEAGSKQSVRRRKKVGRATRDYARAVDGFLARWQLAGMAGPYLPVPLGPLIPVLSEALITQLMRAGGAMLYFPRNFAIPSEDELRPLIEDAIRGHKPEPHLAPWLEIVSNANPNKGEMMRRYGRIFELQHYLRLLRERHSTALKDNIGRLQQAFSSYFSCSVDQIRQDMRVIDAALAPGLILSSGRLPSSSSVTA